MKTISNRIVILLCILCSTVAFYSCETNFNHIAATPKAKQNHLFIRDQKGKLVTAVYPELIPLLQKSIAKKKGDKAVSSFGNTYDLKTGQIKPEVLALVKERESKARVSTPVLTITFDSYIEMNGWYYNEGQWGTPPPSMIYGPSMYYIGAPGPLPIRLQSVIFHTSPALPKFWSDPDRFWYNGYIQGSGWQGPRGQGEQLAAPGQNMEAFWLEIGPNLTPATFYRAYVLPPNPNSFFAGDYTNFVDNGQIIGTPGSGHTIQFIELLVYIYDYDDDE